MTIEVSAVPPDGIEPLRDQLLPLLRRVARWTNGRYEAEDMIELCEQGKSLMFIAFEDDGEGWIKVVGVVICCINIYPRLKCMWVQFIGGDRGRLWDQNMYSLVREFALEHGCERIEGAGRIGWLRWFREFTPIAIMGEIDIVGGEQRPV